MVYKCHAQVVDSLQLMNDLRELSSDQFQGRETGKYGGRLAQYYIGVRFKEIGLKTYTPDYKMAFTVLTEKIGNKQQDSLLQNYKKLTGINMVGYVKGQIKQSIVVSAHYDHLGIQNGQIYNGADDNASGTCALIALAAWFKEHPPKHTIIFAAFDAEEIMMRGSIAFITKPPVPLKEIRMNLNLDMIGTSSKNNLYVAGTYHYPKFKPLLKTIKQPGVKLVFGYDTPGTEDNRVARSDHFVFHLSEIPFLFFSVPEHHNYHQLTDDYENISHSFYYNSVNLILKTLLNIDKTY